MLAIRCGRVFDGERFLPGDGTVLLDEGRIVGVQEGFPAVGDQWQVVEHLDATVLPGLIDTHAHLVTDSGDRALDRVAGYTEEEIDAVVSEGLRRQLAAGVTTVRDLGDRRFCVVDRRDRQRSGRPANRSRRSLPRARRSPALAGTARTWVARSATAPRSPPLSPNARPAGSMSSR